MATDTEPRYFVVEDANDEITLWRGKPGTDGIAALFYRRELDMLDPNLWPALLRGLGIAEG